MDLNHLFKLMIEVMLPISILVGAGALWPVYFREISSKTLRIQLNRLVLNLFYPAILFSIAATTPITSALLSVPLLVGIGSLLGGAVLYLLLYRSPLGRGMHNGTRAALLLSGMIGNTFYVGVPVLTFLYGDDASRYAAFNDMLMTMPLMWSLGVWICTRLGPPESARLHPPIWRLLLGIVPIWAFIAGTLLQMSGLAFEPLTHASRMIGQATIPVMMFVLGLSIPWRDLKPRFAILAVTAVKIALMPLMVAAVAALLYRHPAEAQQAAVIEAGMPTMMSALILADRFHLDIEAAALMIGWTTLLYWLSLPVTVWLMNS
jgi:malate permease and related proteins